METGTIVGLIIGIIVVLILIRTVFLGFIVVKEREAVIIERFGSYHDTFMAGVHWKIPYVDRTKPYRYQYFVTKPGTEYTVLEKGTTDRIKVTNEVIDFPSTSVITRDNASVLLDCILSYQITNPKQMIYSCNNLPLLLSKILQAFVRNMAAQLSIDQIIEESATLNAASGLMNEEVSKWGVKILFVKVQKVIAPGLDDVLGKQKDAQLRNAKIVIDARSHKQTAVIESEGQRDSMIRKQEGSTQEQISQARGRATSIINIATAEARSVKEIARALQKEGTNPVRYLLSLKYLDTMRGILNNPNTEVKYLPMETATVQIMKELGLNTFYAPNQNFK
ncbi:hypothetical protein M0812_05272 [Anaeramoeba flamelloides]|uniref:Band 7 domain-containing protein n=1 Tax=Anaeramoeba flamelloides TaxID=1746091 RepID=A0AAV8A5T8_9EUKA|nr:hypothetical protein M0812_05272 [Anaeramoeba flamelloides]